jgi:hypothetical protein
VITASINGDSVEVESIAVVFSSVLLQAVNTTAVINMANIFFIAEVLL